MKLAHNIVSITRAFDISGIQFALAGGFAFSIHITPRATTDIDFMVLTSADYKKAEISLRTVFRDLIAHKESFSAGSFDLRRFVGIDEEETVIDILTSSDLSFAESAMSRKQYLRFHDSQIPVLSIEDLYIMKKQSGRYQDMHDCEMIESVKKDELDHDYISRWIR